MSQEQHIAIFTEAYDPLEVCLGVRSASLEEQNLETAWRSGMEN